jgi:copper chaperone CopZ
MKFKSNINCQNCVAKVKNTLDGLVGENAWKVDTENPAKILEVSNNAIAPSEVVNKLKRIGFIAEEIV